MNDAERRWHKQRCEQYREEYSVYEEYAGVLERILKAVCRRHAPAAIVQSRPKAFSSFAEKMARKAGKYMALNIEPTDLCGARVITETQTEVDDICAAIRAAFEIDEKNSLDHKSNLRTGEFGYRSFHYVVRLKGPEMFGVAVPAVLAAKPERFAEIQIRTLLQHAHASVSHDRIYKASLKVRENLKRDLARVAAILEEGDEEFGKCIQELDSFRIHYGSYMNREKLRDETDILETVLALEPDARRKPGIALRLAQLAGSTGDFTRVVDLLAPFVNDIGEADAEVLAEHGHALCRVHVDKSQGDEFQQGCTEIQSATAGGTDRLKARVLGYWAWTQSRIPHNETKARDGYRDALDADPSNPFHLASFVGYEMSFGEKLGLRSALAPAFSKAIRKCRDYIDAGIELPLAFFTIGRLQLLLDQPFESLAAYAKGIRFCLAEDSTVPRSALVAELAFVERINRGRVLSEHHTWVRHLLLLGQAVWTDERPSGVAAKRKSFRPPVVIVAGVTSRTFQANLDRFRGVVLKAFQGFKGTIICGGTNAGVAGMVGEIAVAEGAAEGGILEVVGYIPRNLPYDQPVDPRYSSLVPSEGLTYGATHALQYWSDLLLAGIKPRDVRILGIDGGMISAFEYRIALALGSQVGVLEPATRATDSLLSDPDWCDCMGLLRLPDDWRSIQAFLRPPRPALTGDQLESAAVKIHEAYLKGNHYKNPDPAMRPWEELGEGFRNSNRMQAANAAGFLERAGFEVSPAAGKVEPLPLASNEIEVLAEIEHGRWVVERLLEGWRYEDLPKKDTERKRHPSLVPWDKLTDSVKQWDRDAVSSWPKLLADAGLVVRRTG